MLTEAKPRPPSSWVARHASRVPAGGTVLDVACGSGRHSRYFAARGHDVTAVDIDTDQLRADPAASQIECIEADLERGEWALTTRCFDAIVVVNYLHRPHFARLTEALTRGGVLLFDTFAVGNERFGQPRNPDYLLRPGELLLEFGPALTVVAYEYGEVREPGRAVRQRLCGVRR